MNESLPNSADLMRTYYCVRIIAATGKRCGKKISQLRAAARLVRGQKPLYHSDDCQIAAKSQRRREKLRESAA
jgi:hypothetical protein